MILVKRHLAKRLWPNGVYCVEMYSEELYGLIRHFIIVFNNLNGCQIIVFRAHTLNLCQGVWKTLIISTHLQLLVLEVRVGRVLLHEAATVHGERCRETSHSGPGIPLVALAAQHTGNLRPEDQSYRDRRGQLGANETEHVLDVGTGLWENEQAESVDK